MVLDLLVVHDCIVTDMTWYDMADVHVCVGRVARFES